jgi:hydrogenase expression/formation protein HypE
MTDTTTQVGCPIPTDSSEDRITLAHGEGGRLMRRLIEQTIFPRLDCPELAGLHDAARLTCSTTRLAFTTDSYVVSPLFFPGGDIGSLAVHGTVNDLAVTGAVPRWLSLALIVEEGLSVATLERILESIAAAARLCRVGVVTGDTKVVPRGAADGLFITTSGVGELMDPVPPGPSALQAGDILIASGPVGRHGVAVLAAREQLAFDPPPRSDSAPLTNAVAALRTAVGTDLRALRDATRGGVTAVLHEWAAASGKSLHVDERQIPIDSAVKAVSELLGLEPLHIACEGTMVVAVAPETANKALMTLRGLLESREAAVIGVVRPRGVVPVSICRLMGRDQPLDEPVGAPLPRIC